MPTKNQKPSSSVTEEQQRAIVESRLAAAEHALFDAQLTLDVEGAAAEVLEESQRDSLIAGYERQVKQAEARIKALKQHLSR